MPRKKSDDPIIAHAEEHGREHKMGKFYGYETDGVNFWPAPALISGWGDIQDQERALDAVIAATARAVAEARAVVEKQRRQWWDRVYDELGLDKAVIYTFNRIEGKLAPVQQPATAQQAGAAEEGK